MILRLVPVLLALTACSPVAAPATQPAPTTTTTTSVMTTSPRIDTPRDLNAVDACKLLTPEDFDEPFASPPKPTNLDVCLYQVGNNTPKDLIVMLVLGLDYASAKKEQPKGQETLFDGHSVWYSCGRDAQQPPQTADMLCFYTAAVSAEKTLTVITRLPGGNSSQLAQITQSRLRAALKRLPVT